MFSLLFPPDFPYTGQYLVGPSTEQCFCHYNCVQNGDVWKTKSDTINNQKFLANKADSSKSTHLIERRVFIKYNHTRAWDSFVFLLHFIFMNLPIQTNCISYTLVLQYHLLMYSLYNRFWRGPEQTSTGRTTTYFCGQDTITNHMWQTN